MFQEFHDLHFSGYLPPVLYVQPSLVNNLDGNLHMVKVEVHIIVSLQTPKRSNQLAMSSNKLYGFPIHSVELVL